MSYFDHLNRKELLEAAVTKSTCWKCKELMDERELVTVTNGNTSWVELCEDCYRFYEELKRFSKYGKKG
ncbi:hypothetical protein [Halobacillus massiliensis]|uniref:hypothetical protein n=1 Tax=Halobacillus massiliensis TaxID=1926286 RepID=UPI0009E26245|nr:hypothetical protein [Halobacillus massiliensis]